MLFLKTEKTQILESMKYGFLHKRIRKGVLLLPGDSLYRRNTPELILQEKLVLICLYIFPFLL